MVMLPKWTTNKVGIDATNLAQNLHWKLGSTYNLSKINFITIKVHLIKVTLNSSYIYFHKESAKNKQTRTTMF